MSRNYRAKWHDYRARCIYHLTLMKSPESPYFGKLAGDCKIPIGQLGSPYVIASPLGAAIKQTLRSLRTIHPALRLYQYALMPDHLHLLLSVEAELDEILGRKIAIFKQQVNSATGLTSVFEPGFNDQILKPDRNLNVIFDYIRANPYRLAVRLQNPEFFRRNVALVINGISCKAYGNTQLLNNPFIEQVVVHRADNDSTFNSNKERWLHTAANGGVLVSPFISKREKEIRDGAEELGGRFILITERPYSDREKPTGRDFELCTQGRLLIISPAQPLTFGRAACLRMNSLAQAISSFSQNKRKL